MGFPRCRQRFPNLTMGKRHGVFETGEPWASSFFVSLYSHLCMITYIDMVNHKEETLADQVLLFLITFAVAVCR
jgi:hypothetical protein